MDPKSTKRSKLSIMQWNCRALTSKIPHLLYYLQIHSAIDILMLQSLNISPKTLPQLDGYYYPPIYKTENGRVMVATYVSTKLHFTKTEPLSSTFQTVELVIAVCVFRQTWESLLS